MSRGSATKAQERAIVNRLYNDAKVKELRKTQYQKEKEKQDMKECSFVPKVNSKYAYHRNLDSTSLGTTK